MEEASKRSKGQEGRSGALSANLAWLATITVLMLFVIKVLVVAHFNATTALGLLTIVSGPTIFFGVIAVSIVPVLQFLFLLLLVLYDSEHIDFDSKVIIRILIIVAAVLSVFILPWPTMVLLALLLDMFLGGPLNVLVHRYRMRRLTKAARAAAPEKQYVPEGASEEKLVEVMQKLRETIASIEKSEDATVSLNERELEAFEEGKRLLLKHEDLVKELQATRAEREEARIEVETLKSELVQMPRKRAFSRKVFWVSASFFGVLALLACLDDRPWLPPQRLLLNNISTPVVAYELAQQDDSILIMRRDDRTIQEVPKAWIKQHQFCQENDRNEMSPIAIAFRHQRSRYVDCE